MVNNFGPLSPSELLLHYGFVESVNDIVNPHENTDIALSDIFDCAHAVLAATNKVNTESRDAVNGSLNPVNDGEEPVWADHARSRLQFLIKHKFVQPKGCCRYVCVSFFACCPYTHAHPTNSNLVDTPYLTTHTRVTNNTDQSLHGLIETARIVCLSDDAFRAFRATIKQWRIPMALPLAAADDGQTTAAANGQTTVGDQMAVGTGKAHAATSHVPCVEHALQVVQHVLGQRVGELQHAMGLINDNHMRQHEQQQQTTHDDDEDASVVRAQGMYTLMHCCMHWH